MVVCAAEIAVHVVDFAVGGQPAVEIAAVPGGDALGAIVRVFVRDVGAAVDAVGLAHAVVPPPFGTGSPSSTMRLLYFASPPTGAAEQ